MTYSARIDGPDGSIELEYHNAAAVSRLIKSALDGNPHLSVTVEVGRS